MTVALKKLKSICPKVKLHMMRTSSITSITFSIDQLSDEECYRQHRFKKNDVRRIEVLLEWGGLIGRNKYRCDSVNATCIILRCLAYPCRWKDLEIVFGMHSSALSEVFYQSLSLLIEKYRGVVLTFRAEFMKDRTAKYAESVHKRGEGLHNCAGFIDGTKIKMARPIGYYRQRSVYSRHKRMHCLS